jgi:hypothetical protein
MRTVEEVLRLMARGEEAEREADDVLLSILANIHNARDINVEAHRHAQELGTALRTATFGMMG